MGPISLSTFSLTTFIINPNAFNSSAFWSKVCFNVSDPSTSKFVNGDIFFQIFRLIMVLFLVLLPFEMLILWMTLLLLLFLVLLLILFNDALYTVSTHSIAAPSNSPDSIIAESITFAAFAAAGCKTLYYLKQ